MQNKTHRVLIISLVYLLVLILLKWKFTFAFTHVVFLLGGIVGIYFLDGAEKYFRLYPSPFHTVFFRIVFAIVSFFVVTSSGSVFAQGLVLSMFLQMLLSQLHSGLLLFFLLETFFFIR